MSLVRGPCSKADPSDVVSTFSLWGVNGTSQDLDESDGNWIIPEINWDEAAKKVLGERGYRWDGDDEEAHEICLMDVKDDNGNHFIEFSLNKGNSNPTWLGRKVMEGEKERPLSKVEREKLHWDIGVTELGSQFSKRTWSENRDRALKEGSVSIL